MTARSRSRRVPAGLATATAVVLATVAGCSVNDTYAGHKTGYKEESGVVTIATVKDYKKTREEITTQVHQAITIADRALGGTGLVFEPRAFTSQLIPCDNFASRVAQLAPNNTGSFQYRTAMNKNIWEPKVRDAWRRHGWNAGIGELGVSFYLKTSTNVSYSIVAYPPTQATNAGHRDVIGFSTQSDCMFLPTSVIN